MYLSGLIRPDITGGFIRLDGLFLLVFIAMPWSRKQSRIHNRPAHGKVTVLLRMLMEPGKQIVDRPLTIIGLDQVFTEQPDRPSIGHLVLVINELKQQNCGDW